MTEPRQATILVVDDEPTIRELARRLLEREGFAVLDAASGADALAILDSPDEAVDVLLTDVVLPGLTGPALARRAQQRRRGIRVIFLSGYAEQSGGDLDLTELGVTSGVAFLAKPFTAPALLEAVRRAIAGSRSVHTGRKP